MITTFIIWSLAGMLGSTIASRKAFKGFIQARRLMEFRRNFPDHPAVCMVSDHMAADFYDEKKRAFVTALQALGLSAIWPLTVPWMLFMMVYDKIAGINDNMAPKITIDAYKIREEEGF